MTETSTSSASIAFLYLGRRGALGRFTLELAQAAAGNPVKTHFIVSKNNETISALRANVQSVVEIPTFETASPLSLARGFLTARSALLSALTQIRPAAVVTLMPHV